MEIRNIKTFIKITEVGSFSKAADELSYAQSTVTTQIAALEKELGVQLFDRTGKRIKLSIDGKDFLQYGLRLMDIEQEIQSHFSNDSTPKGLLRIGMLESIADCAGTAIISSYLKNYPSVSLDVKIATTLDLVNYLEHNSVDCILTLDYPIIHPSLDVNWSNTMPVTFFCSPNHPFAKESSLKLEDIMSQRLLLTESKRNYRAALENIATERGLVPKCSLEIGSTQILINTIKNSDSICLLPNYNLEAPIRKKEIHPLKVDDFELNMFTQIVCYKDKWISPALHAFIEVSRHELSKFRTE